uniref:Uncharacterized protein n=1 Tax=Manihot esculenta TaxID=3983 RepID=A0A199U9X4_MANES
MPSLPVEFIFPTSSFAQKIRLLASPPFWLQKSRYCLCSFS